jgi:hypothetical protein
LNKNLRLVYFRKSLLGGGIVGKNNNIAKLINQVIDREINSLREELKDEYSKILNDMNSGVLECSGITVTDIENKYNEIIKKHLEAVVKECNEFPSKIEEKDWLGIQEKLILEIEDLEFEYYNKLTELQISFHPSKSLFQESKSELKSLIKESIIKGKIKGFESEAYYRIVGKKISIAALIISIASIILAAIALCISIK